MCKGSIEEISKKSIIKNRTLLKVIYLIDVFNSNFPIGLIHIRITYSYKVNTNNSPEYFQ